MESKTYGIILLLCAVSVVVAGRAVAELEVSVTLSGSIDELLPIIQHLKDMGVGVGLGAEAEEALKLRVHSVITREAEAGEKAPEPEPEPDLALLNPYVTPAEPKPGQKILVTVNVSDRQRKVDTVAGRFRKHEFDLYDNGTHGDKTAGDGVWSYSYELPADATPGSYTFTIWAFDVHGDPVTLKGEDGSTSPLMVQGSFAVSK